MAGVVRNEEIVTLNMEAATHRGAAAVLTGEARKLERKRDAERDMEEAHAQGHHDEISRDGCPECEDKWHRC